MEFRYAVAQGLVDLSAAAIKSWLTQCVSARCPLFYVVAPSCSRLVYPVCCLCMCVCLHENSSYVVSLIFPISRVPSRHAACSRGVVGAFGHPVMEMCSPVMVLWNPQTVQSWYCSVLCTCHSYLANLLHAWWDHGTQPTTCMAGL